MKRIIILLTCLFSLSTGAQLFEVNLNTGSFKDRVSKTLPANSGAQIVQTNKGLVGRFGSEDLNYGNISDLNFANQVFSIVVAFRNSKSALTVAEHIFSKYNTTSKRQWSLFSDASNRVKILTSANGLAVSIWSSTSPIITNDWNFVVWTYESGSGIMYINNSIDTGSGGFSSSIFASTSDVYISNYDNGSSDWEGDIHSVEVYDEIISASKRTELYQQFLRSTAARKPMVTKRSTAEMIVSWSSEGTPSDGQFFTSGNIDRSLSVATGTFVREEISGGKQIRCTVNGTLQIKGVDLSEFVGNGYIRSLGGSLSGDAGGTVDDATAVSFADNTVSIALTAGQTFTGIVIAGEAR